jgi:hypothetical protein
MDQHYRVEVAGQRGSDVVVVLVAAPLPVWAVWRYRHGVASAVSAWTGALPSALDIYAGLALGTVAYNALSTDTDCGSEWGHRWSSMLW